MVPAAFEPTSPLLPGSTRFYVEAYACDRVTGPRSVFANTTWLWVSVAVDPRNASWAAPSDVSMYVVDLLVSEPQLVPTLQAAGLPARAARVTQDRALAAASASEESWTFETPSSSYRLTWPAADGQAEPLPTLRRATWVGEGPYDRYDVAAEDAVRVPLRSTAGLVQATGDAALLRADGQVRHVFEASSIASTRWELALTPARFEGTP